MELKIGMKFKASEIEFIITDISHGEIWYQYTNGGIFNKEDNWMITDEFEKHVVKKDFVWIGN